MPMNEPYRTVYNPGDVFYGLAKQRGSLAQALGVQEYMIWTIDQFDTFAQSRQGGQAAPGLANHPEFNEAVASATENMSSIVDLNAPENWRDQDASKLTGSVARRKCKTGLDYIAHNHPNCTVHFCLTGIDFQAVANKSYDDVGTQDLPSGSSAGVYPWHEKSRSITGAELRWLFRNSHDPAVRNMVQFWQYHHNRWLPCGAPWEDGAIMPSGGIHSFAAYQRDRVNRGAMDIDG